MSKNRSEHLPPSKSIDELVEFFDTHDMGEYWEQMPKAHFDINIKRRTYLVAIDEELVDQLTAIASSKDVSTEQLINSWLREKLMEAG